MVQLHLLLQLCYARILLLVGETTGGGFETLGGDKTQSFISRTEAYRSKNKHKSLIHALSLSL